MISEIRINSIYAHLYGSEIQRDRKSLDSSYKNSLKSCETRPIQKIKTLFTESLIHRYKSDFILDQGLMPPNCRYIESVKNGNIIIIEEPPTIRTIFMQLPLHNEIHQLQYEGKLEKYGYKDLILDSKTKHFKLTLAFPYVIFILYINKSNVLQIGQVFFRTSQMFGLSDYLFKTPLPNISDTQDICFGSSISGRSTLETVQKSITMFWSAPFNTDYLFNYECYNKVPIIRNYLEWEYMSKTNPMFIYNTEWMLFESKTIYNHLKKLKDRCNINLNGNYNPFSDLTDMFNKPTVCNKIENREKIERVLKYDITSGITFNSKDYILFLNVGDTIIFNNGNIGFVESFIGDHSDPEDIKYILIDLNGRKIYMKYTPKLHEYLKSNVIKQQMSQTAMIKNGTIVTPNDIIEFDGYYKQIKYIRKSRGEDDHVYELRMGNEYYFAHEVDGKIIKTDCISINNMVFEKDVNYILIKESYLKLSAIDTYIRCMYKNINLNGDSTMYNEFPLEFKEYKKDDNHYNFIINSNDIKHRTFIKEDDIIEIPGSFRVGGVLLLNNDSKVLKYKNKIMYNNELNDLSLCLDIKNYIDGDKFFVAGPDFDTTFHIGDKVITSNWNTPMDVLNIKTIIKFEYVEKENNIYFVLKDNNDIITNQLYINGVDSNILTGTIRRVVNYYNELYVGMKIKAKESKITKFPKKDTNIIIAIIIDNVIEPLFLCSNGYTLWYSTIIEKFELIDIKNKRWNRLKHVELDINNFQYQPGDIVKFHTIGGIIRFLVYINYNTNYLDMESLENYVGKRGDSRRLKDYNSDLILDCIPMPRIAKNKLNEKIIKSYYHFHGGLIEESKESVFGFIDYKKERSEDV